MVLSQKSSVLVRPYELAEIHVARRRAAIEHQGAKQHFRQQRIGNVFADDRPCGELLAGEAQLIVAVDSPKQSPEVVFLPGELLEDLLEEILKIVREA